MSEISETESDMPPVPRYRLTLVIDGNTLDEVEDELLVQTRGGFLLDSDYCKRDSWEVTGGRVTSRMEHRNPDMTPERYESELSEWFERRKQARNERSTT